MKRSLILIISSLYLFSSCTEKKEEAQTTHTEKAEKNSNEVILVSDKVAVGIAPEEGGKISSLRYNDQEFLSLKNVHKDNWGSTFWASPQKIWGWPPPKAFDVLPYKILSQDPTSIVIQGQLDTVTGLSFKKAITLVQDVVSINYHIKNNTDSVINVAPWEITRVPPNGLSFFPKGEHEQAPFTIVDTTGCIWFDYKNAIIQEGHDKLKADASEGWLAHINGEMILVKFFPNITPLEVDVEEAEIEIYANPDKIYIELEPQGPLQGLEPGEELQWTVYWVLTMLPEDMEVTTGNQSLIELAKKQKEKIPNNQ